jgi:hypothetical protein
MVGESFTSQQFSEWLNKELDSREISANSLALKAGVGAYSISRMRHCLSAPKRSVRKVISALGQSELDVANALESFRADPTTIRKRSVRRKTWEHLCIALQLLGNYPSVEEALTAAISRELSQRAPPGIAQPQISH